MTAEKQPKNAANDTTVASSPAASAGQTLDPQRDVPTKDATQISPRSPVDPAAAPTIVSPGGQEAAPQDATLDPHDPQAQAYQQAQQRATPGGVLHGALFGDYQLLEPIAKGGMGIVYKARQLKLNRIVAIKMILAGQFADRTDVERFYAEAAAAAALSHPHIVAIHEVGEVQGQHFFSMDFVEGQSLAAMVRENPLPPQRAAEYVKTIAETMQFAHDRGIVHRDLKPSNILVDQQLRPLITDFGLAKQVSGQSQLTMSGAIIGTPSYMPPEQAAGDGARVGPGSDVYSTGAILYELLTGRPPFRAASPFETVRQVIETEPLSPRLVNPQVPKDLETICLKCLQKEPAQRYGSSAELASELGRYLQGEPIRARPISRVERLWRLCKRYPISAMAIALAVLSLVIGGAFSTVGYIQTSRALAAEKASFREQMNAVNELFTLVSEDTLLDQPGMQPLRKELLQRAMAYYERFLQQRANDPAVQDELASASYRLGLITETLESTEKALPRFLAARTWQQQLVILTPRDTQRLEAYGNTLNALGTAYVRQKAYGDARRFFDEAVVVRTQLVELAPQQSEYRRQLANTHMNLGLAEYNQRQLASARAQYVIAQQIRAAALQKTPDDDKLRRDIAKGAFNLANLDFDQGDLAQAETQFQDAIAQFESLVKQSPRDLELQRLLIVCLRSQGDLLAGLPLRAVDARASYQAALDRLATLARENPEVPGYQYNRASVYMNLGYLEAEQQQASAAIDAYQQGREILSQLHDKSPDMPLYARDLAVTLRELARELGTTDSKLAREYLEQSVTLLEALKKQRPDDADYAQQLEETQAALKTLME